MLDQDQYNRFNDLLPKDISDSLREIFREKANYIVLKKGDTLINESTDDSKIYYILKGSCVRFIITPNGEQKAIMFHTEDFIPVIGNMYVNSDDSLVNYQIEANEKIELIELNAKISYNWYSKDTAFSRFIYQRSLTFLSVVNQLQNHLIGLTSEQFYDWLLGKYPFIFQRFSSKDIASFMGVSATWLSLLKRKKTIK